MLVKTDLRCHPTETARNISYEPTAPITATNVQNAIEQVDALVLLADGRAEKIVTFAMSPYSALLTDEVLLVDTTGGAVSIVLPLGASRQNTKGFVPLTVKDSALNADVNAISVTRTNPDLINGFFTWPLDSKGISATFIGKAVGGYDVI